MNGQTLFISDLHLDASRPDQTEVFLRLTGKAAGADALYILGDLFEAWLGDDDVREPHPQIIRALHALTEAGTPVYVIRGNRDFLLGDQFASESGATLLDETAVIDLYGEATLIMHGDQLCTSDHEYQKFRLMFTNPQWQQQQLARSFEERVAIAQQMRSESQRLNQTKSEAIMDVELTAVESAMRDAGVGLLIHGHTHRPDIHRFELDGRAARRIVLNDWYQEDGVLVCDADGQRMMRVAELP